MPTVPFHDLLIHPRDNDLIAATHGRGIWIMDDISALQQTTETVADSDGFLFENRRPGTRWLSIRRGGYGRGDLYFRGENPPPGALVHFYLKGTPAGPVTVEISDSTGLRKTTYLLDNPEPGIQRIAWDFRFDPPAQQVQSMAANLKKQLEAAGQRQDLTAEQRDLIQRSLRRLDQFGANYRVVMEIQGGLGQIMGPGGGRGGGGFGGGFGGRGGGGGNVAEPGTYGVRLTVGGKTSVGTVTVRLDPMQTGDGN